MIYFNVFGVSVSLRHSVLSFCSTHRFRRTAASAWATHRPAGNSQCNVAAQTRLKKKVTFHNHQQDSKYVFIKKELAKMKESTIIRSISSLFLKFINLSHGGGKFRPRRAKSIQEFTKKKHTQTRNRNWKKGPNNFQNIRYGFPLFSNELVNAGRETYFESERNAVLLARFVDWSIESDCCGTGNKVEYCLVTTRTLCQARRKWLATLVNWAAPVNWRCIKSF